MAGLDIAEGIKEAPVAWPLYSSEWLGQVRVKNWRAV